ncbi:hypothetical protein BV22DRAFT_928677 [Leucogyrophana mollusca]|uniref:Uncharacterized protein n=1 Tax=Leucogyrophana mollusca TaxID=85980 RepID=A0ACB8AWP1_9AGAM|nr:hypothetical protein BV22DRAFT_928677 [Leucogyrophana mollusca]
MRDEFVCTIYAPPANHPQHLARRHLSRSANSIESIVTQRRYGGGMGVDGKRGGENNHAPKGQWRGGPHDKRLSITPGHNDGVGVQIAVKNQTWSSTCIPKRRRRFSGYDRPDTIGDEPAKGRWRGTTQRGDEQLMGHKVSTMIL